MNNIKEFFSQLFDQLNTTDSWMVILFLFVSWLLGLIWGRLSYRRKYKKLQKELQQKVSDYNVLKAESDALQESYDLASADLKKANLEVETLTTDRVNLHNEVYAANERIQGLELNQQSYLAEVEGLNNEVLNLRGQNSMLTDQAQAATTETVTDHATSNPATDDRLSTIERQLELLINENKSLKTNLEQFNANAMSASTPVVPVVTSMTSAGSNAVNEQRIDTEQEANDDDAVELEGDFTIPTVERAPDRSEKARLAIQTALGSKIPRATAADKDDLKLINGVGPFIEDKLNGIGIYTYQQISKFDSEMINLVTDAIQFFPGRIERDDWVGQASSKL